MILASTLLFASGSVMAAESASITAVAADNSATLSVPKMTWGGCVKKVKRALSKVEGIKVVAASNKTREVEISVADKSTLDAKVKEAIAAIKADTKWAATKK